MLFVFILLLIAAAIATLLVLRRRAPDAGYVPMSQFVAQRRRTAVARSPQPAVARQQSYAAVSIACGRNACKAARRLEGKRGLPRQIPRLPLSLCDAERCDCSYRRHSDRRSHEDRRDIYGSLYGADRRDGHDRRREDNRTIET